ncbi:MAG TPA: DNA recombination protein RmuC [Pseudomonadaceae bacterium]|nr:DNA recombination protein RmuC [Pseudomonadaceae bacterium]
MAVFSAVPSHWLLASLALLFCFALFLYLFFASQQRRHITAIAVLEERLAARELEIGKLERELLRLDKGFMEESAISRKLQQALSRQQTLREQEALRHEEKIVLLQNAREQMSMEFRTLANDILEQKGRSFSERNELQIQGLLKPLGEKIQLFEKKVEDTYDRESKQRFALEKEIKALLELNNRISADADNLTRALKGDNKTQGNWGEVILERVLEKSGLEKGREYEVQLSLKNAEGGRSQPDVVVHLPEGKDLIIDSKVSLKDYEAYFSEADDALRGEYLKRHIQSVRAHVKELSDKQYQELQGVNTLDFVLLFLPLEPAFTLALQQDDELFTDAFSRNIILVGPSTLLATLRTIQSIWRFEYQNRNARLIAESAGKLYEQFVAFTQDLERIGDHLDRGQQAWESACRRLSEGRGNLVRRVERLKELGAKTSKSLGERWQDDEQEQLGRDATDIEP